MDTKQLSILEEAIKLEVNTGRLYEVFSHTFSEDSLFWQQLSSEENNHALLLRSEKELFLRNGRIPPEIALIDSADSLIELNEKIVHCIEEYTHTSPQKAYAYSLACLIENSLGEYQLQKAMEMPSSSRVLELFKTLHGYDKDHLRRIRDYMVQNGINEVSVEL